VTLDLAVIRGKRLLKRVYGQCVDLRRAPGSFPLVKKQHLGRQRPHPRGADVRSFRTAQPTDRKGRVVSKLRRRTRRQWLWRALLTLVMRSTMTDTYFCFGNSTYLTVWHFCRTRSTSAQSSGTNKLQNEKNEKNSLKSLNVFTDQVRNRLTLITDCFEKDEKFVPCELWNATSMYTKKKFHPLLFSRGRKPRALMAFT